MFLLFIFSLVTLCDPLPILSIGIESQETPISQKYTTSEQAFSISNVTSQLFYKSSTSTGISLPTRNPSVLSPTMTSLSSKKPEQSNSSHVISENVKDDSMGESSGGESRFSSIVPDLMEEPWTSQQDQEKVEVPLLIKLDREYTPSEIAEYIYSTGDEKGIAQGIAEMMEDGQIMVSRDDVIVFLEAVEKELAKLRKQINVDVEIGKLETETKHVQVAGAR